MEQDRIDKTLAALKHRGFGAAYFPRMSQAVAWLDSQIPDRALVGVGGSVTVRHSGLLERLAARQVEILDHWQPQPSDERKRALLLRAGQADVYLCSANAVTEDGYILNVDGAGNRVAAHCYGPGRLYLLAGINKLVPDLNAAIARVERIAPLNCRRLGLATPCVATGQCQHCYSAQCTCNAYLVLRHPTHGVPLTVVLAGEEAGF